MTTILDVANKELKDRVSFLTGGIASGVCKDYAEYKHMCGEIRGLNHAYEILNDLARKLEQDDNE